MHIFLRICVLHHWNHFFLIPNAQYPAQRVTIFKSATNLKLITWCKHFINFLSIINYFHYAKEYSIKFTKVKSYWTNVSHRHLVEKKKFSYLFACMKQLHNQKCHLNIWVQSVLEWLFTTEALHLKFKTSKTLQIKFIFYVRQLTICTFLVTLSLFVNSSTLCGPSRKDTQ